MIISSNSSREGAGCPIKWKTLLVPAMSGTELSRVRTEFRLRPPDLSTKAYSSLGVDTVMQSGEAPQQMSDHIQLSLGREAQGKWSNPLK